MLQNILMTFGKSFSIQCTFTERSKQNFKMIALTLTTRA